MALSILPIYGFFHFFIKPILAKNVERTPPSWPNKMLRISELFSRQLLQEFMLTQKDRVK